MSDNMNIKSDLFSKTLIAGQFDNKAAEKPGKEEPGPDWNQVTQDKSAIRFDKTPPEDAFPSNRKDGASGHGEQVVKYKPADPDSNPPASGAAAISLPVEKEEEPAVFAIAGSSHTGYNLLTHNTGALFMEESVSLEHTGDFGGMTVKEMKVPAEEGPHTIFFKSGVNTIASVVAEGMYTIDGTRIV